MILIASRAPPPTAGLEAPTGASRFAPDGALRTALHEATREAHHVIDHHPLVAPLVRTDLTVETYLRALRGLLRIHRPLQQRLADALAACGTTYELADRVGWLSADLAALGSDDNISAPPWTPPVIANATDLAGMLYVIEGSTLGGQVIARRIEASLGFTANHGAGFFNGWGTDTPAHWAAFWQFADGAVGTNTAAATAAARAAFEAIRQGFDEFLISIDTALPA